MEKLTNIEELANIDTSRVNTLNFKILHRNWKRAFAEAFVLMTTASPGEVISIYGPSRTGKTSLLTELTKVICGNNQSNDDEQPLVMIEIDNSGGKAAFSFKSFLQEMLNLIKHPIYSYSIDGNWSDPVKVTRNARTTEAVLARALVEGLLQRKTKFWIVDEAQDMKYAGKDAMAAAGVMDAIKTLAKKANVILVICGTYPILQSINRSGHLENRKHDVHLARYRTSEKDLSEFLWILSNYDAALELDPTLGSLQNCAELLYQGSFGCIGLIRAWLYRASVHAAIDGRKITLAHIHQSMKSLKQLVTSANEIKEGEKLLALEPCKIVQSIIGGAQPLTKKKSSAIPFQRKPKRYEPGNRL
ncbi:AAA family ATPase [Aliikangiella coralliicola]|nr:AAA family ATPase [Aliikangiella coralliicola]